MDFVRCPSGLILSERAAEVRYAARGRPKAIDLFAGAGGMSLGVIKAGFEVVAAVEQDPFSVLTYMTNLCRWGECRMVFVDEAERARMERHLQREYQTKKKAEGLDAKVLTAGSGWISHEPRSTPGVRAVFVGDVRKLSGADILAAVGLKRGEVDLVCGGPPCQGYSRANKNRAAGDPRNDLVFEFARLVLQIQPKSLIMENVPELLNMLTADGRPVIDELTRIFEDGDFSTVDALKRAIAAQTGAVGLLRKKRARKEAA